MAAAFATCGSDARRALRSNSRRTQAARGQPPACVVPPGMASLRALRMGSRATAHALPSAPPSAASRGAAATWYAASGAALSARSRPSALSAAASLHTSAARVGELGVTPQTASLLCVVWRACCVYLAVTWCVVVSALQEASHPRCLAATARQPRGCAPGALSGVKRGGCTTPRSPFLHAHMPPPCPHRRALWPCPCHARLLAHVRRRGRHWHAHPSRHGRPRRGSGVWPLHRAAPH